MHGPLRGFMACWFGKHCHEVISKELLGRLEIPVKEKISYDVSAVVKLVAATRLKRLVSFKTT